MLLHFLPIYRRIPIISFFRMYIVNVTEAFVTSKNAKGGTDTVFDNNRYLTCGVDSAIPLELQMFLLECVERVPAPKDYLQVFELSAEGPMQAITHSSEEPEYRMTYLADSRKYQEDCITFQPFFFLCASKLSSAAYCLH